MVSYDWMDDALCKEYPDFLKWAFPEGKGINANKAYDKAKTVCRQCAVREECLDYGVTNQIKFGVFGGLPPNERHDLRMSNVGRREGISHGTEAGYQLHRRRHVEMCDPCRIAHARYNLHNKPEQVTWRERKVLRVVGE